MSPTPRSSGRDAYILRRLGVRPAELRPLSPRRRSVLLLGSMFRRSFTAPTLALFWSCWNPLYGYYLGRCIYRPARKILPRSLSVIATFAFCGFFAHDILGWPAQLARTGSLVPPHGVTAWFTAIAAGLVLAEKLGLRFDRLSSPLRALVHSGFLAAAYLLSRRFV